jgi:citrate synthase
VEAVSSAIEHRRGKPLPINIDGMLGAVLTDLGFQPLHMPGLAGLSFMPGVIAHSVEEIEQGRKSPSLRVVTDVTYTGHEPRPLTISVNGSK